MVLLVYFTTWLSYYAHIVLLSFRGSSTFLNYYAIILWPVYLFCFFLPEGSLHVSEHGVVICSNNVGTVEHGQRQTVPSPYQRTSDSQCGTDVLRRRATSECITVIQNYKFKTSSEWFRAGIFMTYKTVQILSLKINYFKMYDNKM